MLQIIKKNITAIIVVQFLATVILAFVPVKYWEDYHFLISHTLGYSIASNLIIAAYVWSNPFRFCEIVRAMVVSLLVSNVFGIIATWTDFGFYEKIFDRYFMVAFVVLLWIYLKKKI